MQHGLPPSLIEMLVEMGVVRSGMAGVVPLDYTEIRAYAEFAGIKMGRVAVLMRRMSNGYASGFNLARDEKARPPWGQTESAVSDALGDWLAGL